MQTLLPDNVSDDGSDDGNNSITEMRDIYDKEANRRARISEIVNYKELFFIQKILYFIVYPLVWFFDLPCLSLYPWLKLPLLNLVWTLRFIIAITYVRLFCYGVEIQSKNSEISALQSSLCFIFYTLGMAWISICALHYLKHFARSDHYGYFVEMASQVIAYGVLYTLVWVQYTYYSYSLSAAIVYFLIWLMFVFCSLGIVLWIKQYIYKLPMSVLVNDEYHKYSLLLNLDGDSGNAMVTQNEERLALLQSKQSVHQLQFNKYEIGNLSQRSFLHSMIEIYSSLWSNALGFMLIELTLFVIYDKYYDLLMAFSESSVLEDYWALVIFGFILALVTAVLDALMVQMTLQSPCCHRYIYLRQMSDNCCGQCCNSFCFFLFNWLNAVSTVWRQTLACGIGWSLLLPNSSETINKQLEICLIGSVAFLIFGFFLNKYKLKKEVQISKKIHEIKQNQIVTDSVQNGNNRMTEKEMKSKIMAETRKLIIWNRMIDIYDTSFIVGVAFAWEDLADQSISKTWDYKSDSVQLFLVRAAYAVCITLIFTQLGLEMLDVQKQRLYETETKIKYFKLKEDTQQRQAVIEPSVPTQLL